MNSTICWYCEKEFEYDGEKYRDINCPHCGVQNSIYNPVDYQPYEPNGSEGEKEMIDYSDPKYAGKYVYLPKIGEEATFDIKEIREVKSDNPKLNFSEDVPVIINGTQAIDDDGELLTKRKDLGYHLECELQNGKILSVGSLPAFHQVFRKNNIQDGETWKVKHLDKGKWECEKING